jgi:hypothetical protein
MGTMTDLRTQAESGSGGLEEIFLKLTGGEDVQELVAALRGSSASSAAARDGGRSAS